jgi:hypothetical protein
MKTNFILFKLILFPLFIFSQNSTWQNRDTAAVKTDHVTSIFKTTRIVLGQSVESPAAHDLLFTVSHHFGNISNGSYEFFGLTTSTVRLGLDYGINKRLSAGIGICTFEKNLDGSVKYRILTQTSGSNKMPVTVSFFGEMDKSMLKWEYPGIKDKFIYRLSYASQLLIARKFTRSLSLQLSPSYIHYNFVKKQADQNDVFAIGAGGRYKITKHTSINFDYYFLLPGQSADQFNNSLSVGFDIETGGHVFQLFLTNSQPLFNRGFIAETQGSWEKGNISFGFNINRIFSL